MVGKFEVYEVALELVAALRPMVDGLKQRDGALADQLRRAASSVVLNLAEGNQRVGRDRLHHFRIAAGSAAEVKAVLKLAAAWGYVHGSLRAEAELDRVRAMLWRLTHRRE